MPRNYIRKTDRAIEYSQEKLKEAVNAVKTGKLSGYAASKHYKIPRSTIINHVYERRGLKSNTLGRSTILSREVEENLVKNLHIMEKHGFGLTRKEVLETVGQFVSTNDIENPFKNGTPREDWFLSFKKRHNLSVKKPQPVEYARKKACSPGIIYPYFELLEETVDKLGIREKPSHIWNVDETSFSKDPCKSKVVGVKNYTSTRTIASPGKDNTTVLLGCNAIGEKTPPMIVFKGKNVWDEWTTEEGYPGTAYAATSNGWMETAVFEAFFEKVFLPLVGEKRPILLVYDGHSTHVGINIIEKARAADITILKIPPHTSHLLQPLDLAVNKSFKDKWDAALVKWQRLNIGKSLPKKEFTKMLGQIWTKLEPNICAAGFRKAGIYPLDKNAVPEEKFDQGLLQEWKQKRQYNVINTNAEDDTYSRSALVPKSSNGTQHDHQSGLNISGHDSNLRMVQSTRKKFSPDPLRTLTLASINSKIHQVQSSYISKQQASQTKCIISNNQRHKRSELNNNNQVQNSLDDRLVTFKEHLDINNHCDQYNKEIVSSPHKDTPERTSPKSTIQILENKVVHFNVTFEELLLRSVKAGTSLKNKRKRIATGAEVITHDDVYKKTKLLEEEKLKKLNEQLQKRNKVRVEKMNKDNTGKERTEKQKPIAIKKESEQNYQPKAKKRTTKSRISTGESESKIDNQDENDVKGYKKTTVIKEERLITKKEITLKKKADAIKTEKKQNFQPKAKQRHTRNRISSDSSSESENEIEFQDESDDDYGRYCEEILSSTNDNKENMTDEQIKSDINPENEAINRVYIDEWLLVKFCTKKTIKHYVGVVHSYTTPTKYYDNGIPIIKYARKTISKNEGSVFTFPPVDDISDLLHMEDVVVKLPKPIIGRRGQIIFKNSFDNYNIQ